MAKAAGSLYRGPSLQVKGFGELAQTLLQRQALDNRLAEATKRARERELDQNVKKLEQYASKHAIENLPEWGVPIYADYEEKYSELVLNGEVGSKQAIAYLGSLWDQMSSTQGDKYDVKKDAVNDFEDNVKYGSFEKLVNDGDFTKTTVDQFERSKIITDQNDLANFGFFGVPKEMQSDYFKKGEYAKYWDVDEDENGMPVLISRLGYYDLNGDQIGDENTALKDYTGYGNQHEIFSQDAFVTSAPVPTPGEYRNPLNAFNTSKKYADGKFHRDDVEKYVGEVYLTLDDKESAKARYTAIDYVLRNPENDPELVDLISEDEMAAYIKRDPNMLGGDVENRRMRFDMINENANVRKYIASMAGYEGRDSEEMKQFKKDRAQQQKDFSESKMRIGDSFQILQDRGPMSIINTATGERILDNYSGRIETYAVGDLASGQSNPIYVPNQEKIDEYNRIIQAGRSPQIAEQYTRDMPNNIEIKPERLEIYPDIEGRRVVGIVSRDEGGDENPTVFLEVDGDGQENRDLLSILRTNIQNEYPGVTLDMFFDGMFKGGSTTPASQQDPTPTIDYSNF